MTEDQFVQLPDGGPRICYRVDGPPTATRCCSSRGSAST